MPSPKIMSITAQQIKLIHALKSAIGMDDETYRGALHEAFGVRSSKILSKEDAEGVISYFEREAHSLGVWKKTESQDKYQSLGNRPEHATPAQLKYIDNLWDQVSRAEAEHKESALRKFLQRQAGVSDLRFLKRKDASKVITALKSMKRQGGK